MQVKNPIGYIEEKDVPQKYTTKEGYAVAGPHLDVDDDNDADEKEDAVRVPLYIMLVIVS